MAVLPRLPRRGPLVREVGLPDRTVVVRNQLVFLIALAGVWRIARRYTNARPARLSVVAGAVPGVPCSRWCTRRPLCLTAVSVWAFILVDERHDLAAAV